LRYWILLLLLLGGCIDDNAKDLIISYQKPVTQQYMRDEIKELEGRTNFPQYVEEFINSIYLDPPQEQIMETLLFVNEHISYHVTPKWQDTYTIFMTESGDCKSYVIAYRSILEYLGLKTDITIGVDFLYPASGHTNLKVGNYYLDQRNRLFNEKDIKTYYTEAFEIDDEYWITKK
jgi:hypothetical protein